MRLFSCKVHNAYKSVAYSTIDFYTVGRFLTSGEMDRSNNIAKGGRPGRKRGSVKTEEKKREEYRETIALLKKGYSVRNIAKLQGIGVSTVQRVKNQSIRM